MNVMVSGRGLALHNSCFVHCLPLGVTVIVVLLVLAHVSCILVRIPHLHLYCTFLHPSFQIILPMNF